MDTRERIKRLFFMALYAFAFRVVEWMVVFLALFQFIFEWIQNRPNMVVHNIGEQLIYFMEQIIKYLTYRTDQIPFPFSDLPE